MQDKTIDNALLALRKQIIRGDGKGLEHVEALLSARGVPMPEVRPAKRPDAARNNQMRWLVLEALRDGPKTLREIVPVVCSKRPEIGPDATYVRTTQALNKMQIRGMVRREGRVWLSVSALDKQSDASNYSCPKEYCR